jgi:hypothetical protein
MWWRAIPPQPTIVVRTRFVSVIEPPLVYWVSASVWEAAYAS